jgi:SAM-dependent methyltransferase
MRNLPRRKRSNPRLSSMDLPRLYGDLAWLWPLLSPPEHYAEEAATLLEVYQRRAPALASPRRLLELGAGGGHMLLHLSSHFECTAADVSAAMLQNCAELVPEVRRVQADMRELRLGERFDVVLIHDAIDYMRNPADACAALATAAAHLAPGGVVFIAPTYTRDNFVDGDVADDENEAAGLTYFSYVHDPDPAGTEYELILLYLIRDSATRAVQVIEDRHRCGLFTQDAWLCWLEEAGFDADLVEDDKAWTLFSGTKR